MPSPYTWQKSISREMIQKFLRLGLFMKKKVINGVYDIDGVSLSMPAIVGADGIESDIPINLSGEEALKLKESADSLKKIMETIEL